MRQAADNASGQLLADISDIDTSLVLRASQGALFPSPLPASGEWALLTLEDVSGNMEKVKLIQRTGDTLVVERGQEDTIPRAFLADSRVELRNTSSFLNLFYQKNEGDVIDGNSEIRIRHKTLDTPGAAPTELVEGELAINIPGRKAWIGDVGSSPTSFVPPALLFDGYPNMPQPVVMDKRIWVDDPGTSDINSLDFSGIQQFLDDPDHDIKYIFWRIYAYCRFFDFEDNEVRFEMLDETDTPLRVRGGYNTHHLNTTVSINNEVGIEISGPLTSNAFIHGHIFSMIKPFASNYWRNEGFMQIHRLTSLVPDWTWMRSTYFQGMNDTASAFRAMRINPVGNNFDRGTHMHIQATMYQGTGEVGPPFVPIV